LRLDVNLTDIEIKDGFDPIPAGTYDLLIRKERLDLPHGATTIM